MRFLQSGIINIFTKCSRYVPYVKNIIHDIKGDPTLHVSYQEPSIFSKYLPFLHPLPDALLMNISTQIFHSMFFTENISFMLSRRTLPSMSPIRNPQSHPSTPLLDPLADTLLIDISQRNFQSIFLGVYLTHP